MRQYKTTTYKALTESTTPLKFVRVATDKHLEKLKKNEYFTVMVEDSPRSDSPHIKGIEASHHTGLVGIEKTSGENGFYIAKNYFRRDGRGRGACLIVSVDKAELPKCCILDY